MSFFKLLQNVQSCLESGGAEEVTQSGAEHAAGHDEGERHRGVLLRDVVVNVGDAEGVEEGGANTGDEEADEDERHPAPVPDHLDLAALVSAPGLLRHSAHVLRGHGVGLPAALVLGLVTDLVMLFC